MGKNTLKKCALHCGLLVEIVKAIPAFCLLGVWLCLSASGILNPPGSNYNIEDHPNDGLLGENIEDSKEE